MNSRTVVAAPSALRKHLRGLRPTSCLLISSIPPSDVDPESPRIGRSQGSTNRTTAVKFASKVSEFVERAKFTVAVELGLRNVQSTIAAAYPTRREIESAVELARRGGCDVVVGVGSGAAVDLAKAVSTVLNWHDGGASNGMQRSEASGVELIMAPATLGAAMACMSASPLVFSVEEEALLPLHLSYPETSSRFITGNGATVVVDGDAMAVPPVSAVPSEFNSWRRDWCTPADAALASLTICLESAFASRMGYKEHDQAEETLSALRGHTVANSMAALSSFNSMLSSGVENLATSSDADKVVKSCKHHAVAAAMHAGQLLRFGNEVGSCGRVSAPIEFASALLPTFFPHGNLLTYWASLLPGLCRGIGDVGVLNGAALRSIVCQITGDMDSSSNNLTGLVEWANEATSACCVPTMASLAEGSPDIATLLDRLYTNQSILNCPKYDERFAENVLRHSLNR